MDEITNTILQDLRTKANPETAEKSKRFFKEDVVFLGLKSAETKKIASKYIKLLKDKGKADIFNISEQLMKSGFMEAFGAGCELVFNRKNSFEAEDIYIFKRWVSAYVSNWAACDIFCNHTVGFTVEKFPVLVEEVKSWADSENRWMKRASAVTFVIPAKKGMFFKDILEIADKLMPYDDDLVQKGMGWMLKEAGRVYPQEIFNYLTANKSIMSRTAYRYALEKLPEKLRKEAMKK